MNSQLAHISFRIFPKVIYYYNIKISYKISKVVFIMPISCGRVHTVLKR